MSVSERTTDEELMILYITGKTEAFSELFDRYKGRVQAYLLKQVRDPKAVDDLFQQVFLKLHRSRSLYDPDRFFPAWLFSICRNVVRDYFRSVKRRPPLLEYKTDKMEEPAVIVERSSLMEEVLPLLSERQREVLKLRFEEDMDFDLMAQKMNTTQENVRQILSRALRAIKKRLKP